MNSTDADTELPDGDLLVGIFQAQASLVDRYEGIESERGFITVPPDRRGQLDDRFVQHRIRDLMERTIEELMEAAGTLKNKPWKQTEVATNQDHFYEEVADSLHFFVEMCITAGLTATDLAERYHRKHKVNEMRQETGY